MKKLKILQLGRSVHMVNFKGYGKGVERTATKIFNGSV